MSKRTEYKLNKPTSRLCIIFFRGLIGNFFILVFASGNYIGFYLAFEC